MLQDSLFADWKDDSTGLDLESPEEMARRDPLATQVWRLYSRVKTQLPNAERMENLTWRMMSMNLRRKEMERLGLVNPFFFLAFFSKLVSPGKSNCCRTSSRG